MRTRIVLILALLAGSTALATDTTGYGTSSGDTSQNDSSRDSTYSSEKRESAYDSAIKPDRTMRHNTRQGRAATDYDQNQYDSNRNQQDTNTRDRTMDQGPATWE